ncbi:MAG: response regulator transcription factor [Bacteroidota bacterium]|nr:response regulator transcription factor [Bacteroidota bacterium]
MPETNSISIVIADDHPLFRKGLREVIEAEKHLRIMGEAGDGEEAVQLIDAHKPEVAILDIDMPRLNGLDVCERVLKTPSALGIIILTMYDDEALFERAMHLGVKGYVLKDSAADDIVQGIEMVARKGYFISPSLTGHVMRGSPLRSNNDERLGLLQLTPAERRILNMIATEMTSAQIADELHISPRTVEHHRSNIIGKLGLSGQYALVRFALQHKGNL